MIELEVVFGLLLVFGDIVKEVSAGSRMGLVFFLVGVLCSRYSSVVVNRVLYVVIVCRMGLVSRVCIFI